MGTCTRCDKPMVEVPMTVGGAELVMASCSNCDLRTWKRDGEPIDLTEVLDLTAEETATKKSARAPKR